MQTPVELKSSNFVVGNGSLRLRNPFRTGSRISSSSVRKHVIGLRPEGKTK